MKNLKNKVLAAWKSLRSRADAAVTRACVRMKSAGAAAQVRLRSQRGEFVVNHGVVFLIILVLAALSITLLTGLMNDTIAPTIKQKMLGFFN